MLCRAEAMALTMSWVQLGVLLYSGVKQTSMSGAAMTGAAVKKPSRAAAAVLARTSSSSSAYHGSASSIFRIGLSIRRDQQLTKLCEREFTLHAETAQGGLRAQRIIQSADQAGEGFIIRPALLRHG